MYSTAPRRSPGCRSRGTTTPATKTAISASGGALGSTLVVGDPVGTATGPLNANGVAWVYSNSGGAWALSTNLTPASDGEGDFGESVGVSNGTIVVGGDAKSEPYAAWVFGSPEPSISGFVYNQACTGDDLSGSCGQPTGVAGVMVLVKGNDSKGNLVSQTATTAADGSWSVPVSNGTYEAGPSADGQTFIGPAFSPASIPGIAVNGQSVPNTNFTACLNLGDAAGSATDRSGGTIATESSDHARGDLAPRAASQFLASQCKTTYTITLDATIPHEIVDPSPYAPYNPAKDGQELPPSKYPGESNAFGNKVYGKVLDSLLEQYPKYPACFSADTLELLRKKNVGMGWYTTMSEGSLGSVSIPLLWNQHDQYVYYPNPNQPFTSSFGELTRTWHYWIEDKDKTTVHVPGGPTVKYKKKSFYTCHVTAPVEPMAFVLPGGSDKTGRVDPNAFTIEIVWLIPFNPIGEVIPPNTTAAKVLRYTFGEKLGDGIVESFESLPWPLRFGFTYGVLEGVAEAPELLAEIGKETEAAVKTTAEGAKEIEEGASPLHILHNIHSLYDLGRGIPECYEHCLDALAGYASLMFGKASYPAMVTIIRGKFISNYSSVTDTASGTTTPQRIDSTTLAMSQDATDFPDISVTVDRDAKPNGGNPSSSYCPTQNGQLPWTSPKCIIVGNGGFALGGKISEVLSPFDDGEESVDQIHISPTHCSRSSRTQEDAQPRKQPRLRADPRSRPPVRRQRRCSGREHRVLDVQRRYAVGIWAQAAISGQLGRLRSGRLSHERRQLGVEPPGTLDHRVVAGVGVDAQRRPWDQPRELVPAVQRDQVVAVAPDDQRGGGYLVHAGFGCRRSPRQRRRRPPPVRRRRWRAHRPSRGAGGRHASPASSDPFLAPTLPRNSGASRTVSTPPTSPASRHIRSHEPKWASPGMRPRGVLAEVRLRRGPADRDDCALEF